MDFFDAVSGVWDVLVPRRVRMVVVRVGFIALLLTANWGPVQWVIEHRVQQAQAQVAHFNDDLQRELRVLTARHDGYPENRLSLIVC
jgi:hypothetical protein